MKLKFWHTQLLLANPWKIASTKGSGTHNVMLVELTDNDGVTAYGEAAPSVLYGESVTTAGVFFAQVDAAQLSFSDIPGSMAYLNSLSPHQ